mgnify:CR=1 FL=1
MNKTCPVCQKSAVVHSHIVWQEHEGFLSIVMSKDPEALNTVQHKVALCQFCSIKILRGLLDSELNNFIACIKDGVDQIPPSEP